MNRVHTVIATVAHKDQKRVVYLLRYEVVNYSLLVFIVKMSCIWTEC